MHRLTVKQRAIAGAIASALLLAACARPGADAGAASQRTATLATTSVGSTLMNSRPMSPGRFSAPRAVHSSGVSQRTSVMQISFLRAQHQSVRH